MRTLAESESEIIRVRERENNERLQTERKVTCPFLCANRETDRRGNELCIDPMTLQIKRIM